MAYELPIPARRKKEAWKVKIRDRERLEPPHVTVLRKLDTWRIGLRELEFLVPPGGSSKDLPADLWEAILDRLDLLKRKWDEMHPENPISSSEGER